MSRKFRYPICSYKHALQVYESACAVRHGRAHVVPTWGQTNLRPTATDKTLRRYKLGHPRGTYVSLLPPEINWSMLDDAYLRDPQVPVGRIAFSYTFNTVRNMRDAVVWRPDNSCVIARQAGVPFEGGMRNVVNRFSPARVWRARGQAWLNFTKKPTAAGRGSWGWDWDEHKARPPRYTYQFECPPGYWQQTNQGIVIPGNRRHAPYDLVSGDRLSSRAALARERKQERQRVAKVKRYMQLIANDPRAVEYLDSQISLQARLPGDLDPAMVEAELNSARELAALPLRSSRTAGALTEEAARAIRFEEDFHV